jgi:hypothetical protein
MEDVDVQPDVKEDAIKYLNEMNSKIRDCFKAVESNRDLVMDKAKWNHQYASTNTESRSSSRKSPTDQSRTFPRASYQV